MISRRCGSANEGGKTGRSANGAYEFAGSVAMRCAMPCGLLCFVDRQFPSAKLLPESLLGKMVSPDTKEIAGNPNGSPARGHFPCVL
jgi:hypothetical protein